MTDMTKAEWPSSLDDNELAELDRYLRAHSGEGDLLLDGVHGLLSALAVGPLLVLPDEWLPEVLHEPFADEDEGNRVLALLAKLNDSIVLSAVNQYWQAKPATEEEVEMMVRQQRPDASDDSSPPRQRSGHWVH
jgi:yecA family protein